MLLITDICLQSYFKFYVKYMKLNIGYIYAFKLANRNMITGCFSFHDFCRMLMIFLELKEKKMYKL